MNAAIDKSIKEEAYKDAGVEDVYYATKETTKVQAWPTTVNSRFTQAFTSLGGGVSQFTIPASAGVSDVICVMQMPNLTGIAGGLALPRGWGYDLISRISYRFAGAQQMFISGAQNKLLALKNSPDAVSRDAIFALGGQELKTAGDFAAVGANNYAYVVLSIPGTTPSKSNKSTPIDTSSLTQQIIVTVELNPLSAIFSNNGGSIPAALSAANFQAVMVELSDAADALSRRVNLAAATYIQPVIYTQQETQVACANTNQSQTLSLLGFRAGAVKEIDLWLTRGADTVATANNPGCWYAPVGIQVSYAGTVMFRADADSSQLLNLISQKQTSKVSGSYLTYAGGAYSSTPQDYRWVACPFAQPTDTGAYEHVATGGLRVTNGVLSVQLTTADKNGLPAAAADYVLHASYDFESALVYSQGTVDFIFP